jgi:hypothetical protein
VGISHIVDRVLGFFSSLWYSRYICIYFVGQAKRNGKKASLKIQMFSLKKRKKGLWGRGFPLLHIAIGPKGV